MKNKNVFVVAIITAIILSIPLIAMQFSDEWDWKLFDFIIMGSLIFITGMAINWALTSINSRFRFLIAGAILFAFLLIWAELAVGFLESLIAGS